MKPKVRKVGMSDYEMRDYHFKSKASKKVRKRMAKRLRSREKKEINNLNSDGD
jgi:hypothetical protein